MASPEDGLKIFYTNADQFVNKRDDLQMRIANDEADMIFITEVIPKKQANPITQALLHIAGYNCHLNFQPEESNLGAVNMRGVAIYSKINIQVNQVEIPIPNFINYLWLEHDW